MFELEANESVARPPDWAVRQRDLFEVMEGAVDRFVADYFDEDGEPLWPPEDHVGVDGFDDVVEGFYNWPLVYAMGGDERFLTLAQEAYEGALARGSETETPFGHPMVVDEFEQCRDWFHMGEGNLFTYNMGLAAPEDDLVARSTQLGLGSGLHRLEYHRDELVDGVVTIKYHRSLVSGISQGCLDGL